MYYIDNLRRKSKNKQYMLNFTLFLQERRQKKKKRLQGDTPKRLELCTRHKQNSLDIHLIKSNSSL